jgi:hypothetical protein
MAEVIGLVLILFGTAYSVRIILAPARDDTQCPSIL